MKNPCKQCPYRKESAPGYLGNLSYKPTEFLKGIEHDVHECHLTVNYEENDYSKANVCIGALQFMNNSAMLSKNNEVATMQKIAGNNIVPNGRWTRYDGYEWKNGTESQHAVSPLPFGMMVYVRPFYKKTYQYKSGTIKTELSAVHETNDIEETKPNLHWLTGICSMSPDGLKIQEIDYTEEVAAVFVNMIKSICSVNERIKDFISPDQILLIAKGNQKLLG